MMRRRAGSAPSSPGMPPACTGTSRSGWCRPPPFHCSTDVFQQHRGGAPIPALLKITSTRPNAATVLSNSALTEAGC